MLGGALLPTAKGSVNALTIRQNACQVYSLEVHCGKAAGKIFKRFKHSDF